MKTHDLSLEVSDFCNPKVLRVFDTSRYCDADVENYLLEIMPPQKSTFVTFFVQKGFSLAANSSSLKYKKVTEEDDLRCLPDGIYEIKQSYKPNIHTVSHYYHLRTVELRLKIGSEWNKLLTDECKISREEFYRHRDKLREIDEYAAGAKYMVEECNDKTKGKEMYEWAVKLLEQYTNECQC